MHSLRPYRQPSRCDNMNHYRQNAPIAHCPQCGERVNANVDAPACDDAKHAAARRRQTAWCTDCGERLIATFLK
jgi:DNA-directed RNA polymerase subunit RPC12/RpoP